MIFSRKSEPIPTYIRAISDRYRERVVAEINRLVETEITSGATANEDWKPKTKAEMVMIAVFNLWPTTFEIAGLSKAKDEDWRVIYYLTEIL